MTDKIQELIRTGDLATQGEWKYNCNSGVFYFSRDGKEPLTLRIERSEKETLRGDIAFITQAANARDDIKALKAERDRYREALDAISCKKLSGNRTTTTTDATTLYLCIQIAKQALKQED